MQARSAESWTRSWPRGSVHGHVDGDEGQVGNRGEVVLVPVDLGGVQLLKGDLLGLEGGGKRPESGRQNFSLENRLGKSGNGTRSKFRLSKSSQPSENWFFSAISLVSGLVGTSWLDAPRFFFLQSVGALQTASS